MAHFEIKNLSFSYPAAKGKYSLADVNLSVEKGEYVVFCGKSGSGKTTLLRHLKSVLAPHGKRSGEILFNGLPLHQASQLDPIAASDFLNTVRRINQELGTTIPTTEHRLEDIFPYADRAVVMDSGSVIGDDTPRRFFGNNSFYTTAANRMSRHVFSMAVTAEDIVTLCKRNEEEAV